MHRVSATPDEFRHLVEGRFGGMATALYVVPVRHIAGNLVWEGNVHVFHLTARQQAAEAYAWTCPFDGDHHAVLKSDRIAGPAEAVRSTLEARGWLGGARSSG
jgi:hypothetical protein